MKRTTTLVIALWAVFVAQTAFAQKGNEQQLEKEANTLFSSGEYLKAFPLFSQLVSLYPNHADYNYKFGACAIYSDPDKTKAVKFLTIATNKNCEDKMAWYYLGKAYHLNYQFREAIKAYENFLRNADPKLASKTDAQREIETCIYGSNLLANIKDIDVISKTESDKENFFRYFNLEAIGGKILTVPDELKTKLDLKSKETGVIHYPANSTTIYFSSYGTDGKTGKDIYKAQVLPDGKFSKAEKLKGDVNTTYDEDYCFMHSDGKTLYFASKGHNSMGGYDIFKCIYDGKTDSFGPAINLDFAINTPDDDIFYIADSLNQKAYFASGRTSDQKHLNVYNVMVEGTPLQVVYIKGEFISEINADQKKAGFKVIDPATGRMVSDANTNTTTGNYMLYVPKSGEYSYKVVTENSPVVHEVKVKIPPFSQPVALRQQVKLISEGGKDKIVVTNFFDTPLDEDLSALAAEMLRKKAGLDPTPAAATASVPAEKKPAGAEAYALEKTMTNAPVAAGFADGITVQSVITGMEAEAATIGRFVKESDQKYENSYAFAARKQKEADKLLQEAQVLRDGAQGNGDADIKKMRESIALVDKAGEMQREAMAAITAGDAVKNYKNSEAERAQAINDNLAILKQAEASGNFDGAVAALSTEKERQVAMRAGTGSTPYDEMIAKAKARESEQQKAEEKLSSLREDEKTQTSKLKAAEDKMAAAKKDKEKQAAETELVEAKSALDNTRRNIVQQTIKTEKLSDEAKAAYANAELYKRLSEDTGLGLAEADKVKLSDTEKTSLTMKVSELKNRVDAMEVTDPKILAMVTDSSMDQVADIHSTPAERTTTTYEPTARPQTQGAEQIRSQKATALARTAQPGLAPARHMFLAQNLAQANAGILELERKKQNGTFTNVDNQQLAELTKLRTELQAEMASTPSAPVNLTPEELRATYMTVEPGYNEQTMAINNAPGSEIDHAVKMMEYKEQTLGKLEAARLRNAEAAMATTDQASLAEFAKKDQQLEYAIHTLENETGDLNQFRAAYENENKSIIESDAIFAGKLQEQIDITESYISALDRMEKDKQKELDLTTDMEASTALRIQIGEIKQEKADANTKLENYRNDLNLTAATAEPKVDSTRVKSATTLEDAMEDPQWNFDSVATEKANAGDPVKTDDQKNAETVQKMFKPMEESESIFAYESGVFEEIVAEHQSPENEIKNRDKIQEMNDQIFLLEAEMENEKSPAKLRKLDYKAEQLYLRRSMIEIDNAPAIANMTRLEYDQELKKADDMCEANREKIDSKEMVKKEIERLRRDAEQNMADAQEIRKKNSPAIQDEIERADYCRQAFSKEALAIEQLRRIQFINENIGLVVQYKEADLAVMKTGQVPVEEVAIAADSTGTNDLTTAIPDGVSPGIGSADAGTITNVNGTGDQGTAGNTTGTPADGVALKTTTSETGNVEGVTNFSTTGNGDILIDSKKVYADAPAGVNMTFTADTGVPGNNGTNSNIDPATGLVLDPSTVDRSALNIPKNGAVAVETIAPLSKTIGENGTSDLEITVGRVIVPGKNNPGNAADASSAGAGSSSAPAGYMMSADDEDYYFAAPEYLTRDLFKRTTRAVYSDAKPIPIDIALPKGVYYKVQVGAFRNDIPQNLYDEFAPVSGESLNNGITRYTAGFFMQFTNADEAKKEIRKMGYSDAFVVAFRDGKRIPLYEAMGKTEGESFASSVEKEYVHGDKGEAPKGNIRVTPIDELTNTADNGSNKTTNNKQQTNSTTGTTPSTGNKTGNNSITTADPGYRAYNSSGTIPATDKTKTDYYRGANAAPASQVETMKGLFYTVQVGVYSKPVPARSMFNINPLNSELTETKKIRYTAGVYTSMSHAILKRDEARIMGIKDAFITAYYNGKRITLSEADELLKTNGPSILIQK